MKLSQNNKKLVSFILVIFFSLTMIIAGVDKFFNLFTNWVLYLNPKLLPFPIPPSLFMKLVGIFEVLLGLSLFSRRRKTVSYMVAIWFVFISINLLSLSQNSAAPADTIRSMFTDILRAIGAFLLAKLSE